MDLIFTNKNREDIGVLQDYDLDLAFGADENNFECTIPASSHCCEAGSLLYMEGTEYGGIVDSIESKTDNKEVVYSGRTWHGILESKVVVPLQSSDDTDSGIKQEGTVLIISSSVNVEQRQEELYITDGRSLSVTVKKTASDGSSLVDRYLVISGEANDCIQFILDRVGLSGLFASSTEAAGEIRQYQFNRYTDTYSGLVKMLASAGLKLKTRMVGGQVVLSAEARHDYSADEEFDSDLLDFSVKKKYQTVNHLICLGSGEMENRTVIHLFADKDGNISQTQTQFGLDECVDVYDYSSVESEEELIKGGTEELKKMWTPDSMSVDFDDTSDNYDVGDTVGAVDNITGIVVVAVITKKIVTIKNGQITISYKVGE